MAKRIQLRRVLFLVFLLGAAFASLGYRLVDLQVLRHDELLVKAQQNTQREFFREPRRGDLLDAKGNQLATSIFVSNPPAVIVQRGNPKESNFVRKRFCPPSLAMRLVPM